VTEKKTSRVPEEKTPSGLTAAILENGQSAAPKGIMDDATYERIAVRHLGTRGASRRLAPLGGTMPNLNQSPGAERPDNDEGGSFIV
jgi:hypothetical protein